MIDYLITLAFAVQIGIWFYDMKQNGYNWWNTLVVFGNSFALGVFTISLPI